MAGDYTKALDQADQAVKQMPTDPTLHEFRALSLFALGRYDEAAPPLYAVLSSGPGWDWATMVGFYPNVASYTTQLRALEASIKSNPQSAPARFVLAYQYLTEGFTDAAVRQLKQVVILQPRDTVSVGLLRKLDPSSVPASGGSAASNLPAPADQARQPVETGLVNPTAPGKEGQLDGTWVAEPDAQTTITLTFPQPGRFQWVIRHDGQDHNLTGRMTSGSNILTLAQDQGSAMVGNLTWQDETHFTFKVPGAPPEDHGLAFHKTQ